jgi:large subunit ribosomal protein L21
MAEKEKKTTNKKEIKPKAKKPAAKPKTKKSEGAIFAVIETGGKQYIIREGEELKVEKIKKPAKGKEIVFDKVLLIDDGKKTELGTPYITGRKITAEFLEEGRGKKITVLKYKRKTRYKVKRGHRQPYTKTKIKSI